MASIISNGVSNVLVKSAAVFVSTVFCFEYVGGIVISYGPSMEPTLRSRDILLTDCLTPRFGRIKHGDVIVASSPEDDKPICKRVVGLAGDKMLVRGISITVPKDCVWLEGDNKQSSWDSRHYGPVPLHSVKRRCYLKIWPDISPLAATAPK